MKTILTQANCFLKTLTYVCHNWQQLQAQINTEKVLAYPSDKHDGGVQTFVAKCCRNNPQVQTRTQILFLAYKKWASDNHVQSSDIARFSLILPQLGYVKTRHKGKSTFLGLGLG